MRLFLLLLLLTACTFEDEKWECELRAAKGELKENILDLYDVNTTVALFQDTDLESATVMTVENLVEGWTEEEKSAVLFYDTDQDLHVLEMKLSRPQFDGKKLSFKVRFSQGATSAKFQQGALFCQYSGK
ncbi:MAG: hypothetical protein H7A36_00680 [Chlamydiales bacterium]|nr:hypothetical protein [Chlamydiales bacterium]